jgi:hypothetical protein
MMKKKRSVYEEILGIFTGNCAYDVLRGVSKPAEKQLGIWAVGKNWSKQSK